MAFFVLLTWFVVAPAAMADHNVVCTESPYNGPDLPGGVEIGTALRCENLGHEPVVENDLVPLRNVRGAGTPSEPLSMMWLTLGLLLPVAVKLGWSLVANRRRIGVVHHA